MKKNEDTPELITEHIFEIQHEASGKILDIRGSLADAVRGSGMFPDWQIDPNGVKFFNAAKLVDKEIDAIVGYNFIRFNNYNPPTRYYFGDHAEKFIKILQKSNLYDIPDATRFGIRTKCFMPCNLVFDEANKKIFSLFYKDEVIDLFGGIQKDLQVIIQIKNGDFQVKTCLGPVNPDEVNKYFGFKSDKFNRVGIYIDIDCFQEGKINYKNIRSLIDNAMKITWGKIGTLLDAIGV